MNNKNKIEYIEIPSSLQYRLESLIDDLEKKERLLSKRNQQMRLKMISIAASVLIIFSVGFTLSYKNHDIKPQQLTDQELCIEAQKALELVAINWDKGLKKIDVINEEIEKVNQVFENKLIK